MTAIAGITEETKENGKDREKTYYIHNKKTDAKSYKRWEEENLTGGIKEYEKGGGELNGPNLERGYMI